MVRMGEKISSTLAASSFCQKFKNKKTKKITDENVRGKKKITFAAAALTTVPTLASLSMTHRSRVCRDKH